MTDSDFPIGHSVQPASHRAVEQRLGSDLSIHRWRGNIWFDGLAPWEEFDWIDKDLQIGGAILRPMRANRPLPGDDGQPGNRARDADTLAALDTWGHQDFGVRAEVIQGGRIAIGDTIEVL